MSAITTKTEDITRLLGIRDEWRVKQIDIGEVVQLLLSPTYGAGESIYTKIKVNAGAQVTYESDDGDLLVIRGDRVNMRRIDKIVGPSYAIVYNVHTPSRAKNPPYSKLVWLFVSPLVDVDALTADYREIFG